MLIIYLCAGLPVGGFRNSLRKQLTDNGLQARKHVGVRVGDLEALNDGNRGSERVKTRLGFTPAECA
ncbi:hypothetical protein O1432_09575 [Bacteroides fragilis]|uniref:hypothetical protein n=1 Tax=Bacteroides TaxID=816 RepID=UPI0022AAE779|nr:MULTISPECIES: hypothetical protein [Bacteroides]MCZ2616553.1 hypothetical protein [Bacteroides fragilis]MCZ2624358.1 hypothetical protein [Bacteroides fragilis]MDV6192459.1 hypothetical protein [Bacteroides hominis (ex Liu et al. 2022)]